MIINADCIHAMKDMPDNSVDSIVTDPPYGLSFMGKKWDYDVPSKEIWTEALRVLKPGGHLLSFGGSRTYHRMAVAIEDVGFEIRDQIMWVYGSGFPKSLNIGKAVDKLQGNERVDIGFRIEPESGRSMGTEPSAHKMKDESDERYGKDLRTRKEAKMLTKGTSKWEGWGTALKPAHEPIVVARKPLSEKTVALNVLRWGTGGINIDGSRVATDPSVDDMLRTVERGKRETETWEKGSGFKNEANSLTGVPSNGRFPANFMHDGSDEVLELFPNTKSGVFNKRKTAGIWDDTKVEQEFKGMSGDSGSAARFFYCAKASKRERNEGCEGMEIKQTTGGGGGIGDYLDDVNSASGKLGSEKAPSKNNHPTVKPIALMQYLVKLVTPPQGIVLDPFMGSGTTGIACKREGFEFIGIEMDEEYYKIAEARIHSNG